MTALWESSSADGATDGSRSTWDGTDTPADFPRLCRRGPGRTEVAVEAEGGYVVVVVARDQAGHESRDERSFVLDLTRCTLGDLEPPAGTALQDDRMTLRSSHTRLPEGHQQQIHNADQEVAA